MTNPYDEDFVAENYIDWLFQDKRSNRTQLVGLVNLIATMLPLAIPMVTFIPSAIAIFLTAIAYYSVKVFVYEKRLDLWRDWEEKNRPKRSY